MNDSLSLIFPVKNQQNGLERRVISLLDQLEDLTHRLQLIAVDDQSSDATPELLDDLARRYPQVVVCRKSPAVGPALAVESSLFLATGEIIFLHQSYGALDFHEVDQLWWLRHDKQLVVARATTRVRKINVPDGRLPGDAVRDGHGEISSGLRREGQPVSTDPWSAPRMSTNALQMLRKNSIRGLSTLGDSLEHLEVTHSAHRRITSVRLHGAEVSVNKPHAVGPVFDSLTFNKATQGAC